MLNKLISSIGVARQTALGTVATTPTWVSPLVGSGAVAGVEPSVSIDEETGQSYAINAYLEEISSSFDTPVRAYPKTLGEFLYGLFGAVVTTAATTTGFYKHVFSVDATSQTTPWYTLWGNIESEYVRSSDAKVGAIEISWDGNKPLEAAITFACIGVLFGSEAARPTGGTDMAGLNYFTPAGLTFKFAPAGSTLVETKLTKFGLKLTRNVNPEYFSGSALPGDLSMGKFEAAPSFTLKPDDLSAFRTAITGSATGTAVAESVVTGAYEVNLTVGSNTLKISGPKVPFKISWPDSDASGGAVELEVSADNQLGTSSVSPITIELTNDVASYTA